MQYQFKDSTIHLDAFDHILRVAIIRDGSYIIPTYTVCPEGDMPRAGRSKLSTNGFKGLRDLKADIDTFVIDDVTITVDTSEGLRLTLTNDNGLLFKDRDYIAYNFEHRLGDGSCHYISREPDEKIFGLGDKTGPVNKNGMSFKLSSSDAMGFDARTSDPLYKHLPFYICENTAGAYGIYYDTYSQGEFNFGREINNYYAPFKSFRCDEENLVYYVIFGTIPEIVSRFSRLCGPLALPPEWTLKYAGSTMSYTDADDADDQLRGFIELCKKYDLNPGGFYLSSGYTQIGIKRYVFNWNTDKIPSPEGLAQYFKKNGVEFFPNVKPCFLINHPMYDTIAKKGWFLHYSDGSPAIFPFWDDYGSYLDFTNPGAYDFWTDCVEKQLVDKGYRNIWNDNNEYDVPDKQVWADGFGHPVQAYLIRPLFSYLMTMASRQALINADLNPDDYGLVSRSGIGGLGRIASTWTGDNNTSWEDFRYNHKMAMTMSISGFFNFGQDIGGFAGPAPDKELFMRWIQYGIFTPRFVLHSWNPDGVPTMPWLYPDMMEYVKRLFDLRDSLIPYLYEQMKRSCSKNEPVIYPIFFRYPDYDVESDAFFFGDDIIVAPVFDRGAESVTVELPANPDEKGMDQGWYYMGKKYEAGSHTLPCSIYDLPVFFTKGDRHF